MMFFHRLHLRTKLALLFLLTGIIPMVGFGWIAIRSYTRTSLADAGRDAQHIARCTIDGVDRTLSNCGQDALLLAALPSPSDSPVSFETTANSLIRSRSCYDLILMLDAEGTVVGCNTVDHGGRSTAANPVGLTMRSEAWFGKARSLPPGPGKVYYEDATPSLTAHDVQGMSGYGVTIAAPAFGADGRLAHVVCLRVSWSSLVSDTLAALRGTYGSATAPIETQVLSRSGLVLDDADPNAILTLNLVEKGLECAKQAGTGLDGFTTEIHRRTKKQQVNGYAASHGYETFPGLGWALLVRKGTDDVYSDIRGVVITLISVLAAGALFLVSAGFVLSRSICRPVEAVAGALNELASGDLSPRLPVTSQDEVGQMSRALNQAAGDIGSVIGSIQAASAEIHAAATQVSNTTTQMSDGSQQQASALEETAASLEQITGTVKQNAESARQANQLAAASRDVAEKGGKVVADAVLSIQEISKSSEKIANIITTIDEIAFQTNLLALNAAVEAARAGEQGRGFAVVASEVRSLAQRSATSAKEIKALIEESLQKVQAGSELVNKSGQSLDEIMTSVKRVTDIIAEIAAASQEQATGVDQVNRAVTQMDQVVQQNAGQASGLAATAGTLAGQAQDLQQLVARFRIDAA